MEDDGYVYHVFVKSGFDVANKHIGKIRATSPATIGEELDINPLSSPELIQQKDDIPVDNNCFVGGGTPKLVSYNGSTVVTVIDMCTAEEAGIREDAFPCLVVEGEIKLMADDRTFYVGPDDDGPSPTPPYMDQLNEIIQSFPRLLITSGQFENARNASIERMEANGGTPRYSSQLSLFQNSSRA